MLESYLINPQVENETCPVCLTEFECIAQDLLHGDRCSNDDLVCPTCGEILWKGSGLIFTYGKRTKNRNVRITSEVCPICGSEFKCVKKSGHGNKRCPTCGAFFVRNDREFCYTCTPA